MSYKYLGIFIDKDLNWNTHIQYVTKKVLKACGALAKLRHCVCIETLKNVYYSIVYSYIRYGFMIWAMGKPQWKKNKWDSIQSINQNRFYCHNNKKSMQNYIRVKQGHNNIKAGKGEKEIKIVSASQKPI